MSVKNQNTKIIFGLKLKQLRQEKELSFKDLAKSADMSVSYLNEIEKGKKYPKKDKIDALAEALNVDAEELISLEMKRGLAPVGELLRSNFLNELPLDLFGIELAKVAEIIANAPMRVGAFISTLVELGRSYAVHEENFYHRAMRAYQELHYNYFEDIEKVALELVEKSDLSVGSPVTVDALAKVLKKELRYKIDFDGLKDHPALSSLRAVFIPKSKKLLLNGNLTDNQKAFQIGKELGFHYLKLKERANTSSLLQANNFEEVLSHYKASYFAVALLINRDTFVKDVEDFFSMKKWNGQAFLALMEKYQVSPEMMFQRLTSILPRFFNLPKLYFIRCVHDPDKKSFEIDKELHLNHKHHPHGNGLFEHYCRRWQSLSLLSDLHQLQNEGKYAGTLVGAQRSTYHETNDEYISFTLSRAAYPKPNKNVSVTIGLLLDDSLKEKIKFWNDPSISVREVNNTCQRCPIENCADRAAPATIIDRRKRTKEITDKLMDLT